MTQPIAYPPGVIVSILRDALPGATVETQQASDLEDRVPYVAVHVQGGSVDPSGNLINATAKFDSWAKSSVRASWNLAMQVIFALQQAVRDQTMTPDGYLKFVDASGDLPQELRLVGQSADLFHHTWTTDIGVRPSED